MKAAHLRRLSKCLTITAWIRVAMESSYEQHLANKEKGIYSEIFVSLLVLGKLYSRWDRSVERLTASGEVIRDGNVLRPGPAMSFGSVD